MTVRPKSRRLFTDEPSSWWCPPCEQAVPFDHDCPRVPKQEAS